MVRQLRTQSAVILPSRYSGRIVECCWSSAAVYANPPVPMFSSPTALTGSQAESQAPIQGVRRDTAGGTRHRRAATEETYWAYSGVCLCLYFFLCDNQSFHCGNGGELSSRVFTQFGQFGKPDNFQYWEKSWKLQEKYQEKLVFHLAKNKVRNTGTTRG